MAAVEATRHEQGNEKITRHGYVFPEPPYALAVFLEYLEKDGQNWLTALRWRRLIQVFRREVPLSEHFRSFEDPEEAWQSFWRHVGGRMPHGEAAF